MGGWTNSYYVQSCFEEQKEQNRIEMYRIERAYKSQILN